MFYSDILAVILAALASLALFNYFRKSHSLPLPPGPKPLPLIGNLFDIPVTDQYRTFTEWGKQYGDVVYVNALGNNLIILNSDIAAKDLLDTRSAIYSDRPFIPMMHDPRLMNLHQSFVLRQYGVEWRRERRLFTQYLGQTVSHEYHDTETLAAHSLLRSMLDDPDHFEAYLRHAASEAILAIAYGHKVQKTNDPYVEHAEYASKIVGAAVLPGGFLVNVFPWMKYIPSWMPGAGFKKYALEGKLALERLVELPFEDARRRIAEGKAKPSLVTSALADSSTPESLRIIKNVASTMYGAGGDTTISAMYSCMLALVLYPEVQVRAQAELDSVIGSPTGPTFRLPTFADSPRLPYIDAIVKESLRWLPTAPIGVPHALMQDDVYRGWRIPKGSTVIANGWAMLRNEETYRDPLEFRPERFLGNDPAPHPIFHGCFGFGRRECPGRYVAEATLWINIASLMAVFNISAAKDKDGRVIDVNYAREPPPGLTLHPQHFPCVVKPRSLEAEKRIRETHIGDY